MRRLALILLACLGCADVDPYQYVYKVDCFEVHSELPLSLDTLTANIRLGEQMLDDAGQAPDVCRVIGPTRINVLASRGFACAGTFCDGEEGGGPDIFLDRRMQAFVHELLHRVDVVHGSIGTWWHEHWTTNGHYDVDNAYRPLVKDPVS